MAPSDIVATDGYALSAAVRPETMQQWTERLETDYFSTRDRTAATETTWKDDYLKTLRKLLADRVLTGDLVRGAILATGSQHQNLQALLPSTGLRSADAVTGQTEAA